MERCFNLITKMNKRVEKIVSFIKEIEKFKNISRETYTSGERKESDAEHSWHLAISLMLLEKDLEEKFDILRAIKMALIHDLVEIYSGDTFAYDYKGRESKKAREDAAAKKLFGLLPEDIEKEWHELWNEFEENKTKEAKIVTSIDKIHPIFQNICSNGKGWKEHNVKPEEIDNYKRKLMEHNKIIKEIYESAFNEAKNRGTI